MMRPITQDDYDEYRESIGKRWQGLHLMSDEEAWQIRARRG